MRIDVVASLPLPEKPGDGFVILSDEIGHHGSKDGSKLDFPLRRLTLKIDDGRELTLITNDLDADALELGQLYKTRWDIELLFRWLKQHLKIRSFLGRSETAIRIQLLTAIPAFAGTSDRLPAAAHRRPPEPVETASHPLRRTGWPLFARA